jgi:hypothetical protein
MLADRYGLPLSTASSAARDNYVAGCDLLLAVYPGALEAFDRAISLDPGFALARVRKAQVLLGVGSVPAALESMAAAKAVSAGLPASEGYRWNFVSVALGTRRASA